MEKFILGQPDCQMVHAFLMTVDLLDSPKEFLYFLFLRNHKLDYSISIHVSLSGALFLLNTTFLLTEWGATVDPDWVCVFVAALMHYSLLCCFTWMAIEALHLYLLLIKVFNAYYKHYLVKLSLAGWGECYKTTYSLCPCISNHHRNLLVG